jgi:hypothetical protein
MHFWTKKNYLHTKKPKYSGMGSGKGSVTVATATPSLSPAVSSTITRYLSSKKISPIVNGSNALKAKKPGQVSVADKKVDGAFTPVRPLKKLKLIPSNGTSSVLQKVFQ